MKLVEVDIYLNFKTLNSPNKRKSGLHMSISINCQAISQIECQFTSYPIFSFELYNKVEDMWSSLG